MPAESTIGITITAEGGEAAAAEIQKLTTSISGAGDMLGVYGEQAQAVTASTTSMASGFEHVGLHVFGHQLFELAGITGQTRPLIMGLSLAIRSLAESFSIAAGPVAAAAVSLAALFAALRSTNDESEKAATKASGLYQGYKDAATSLDEYAKAGSHLSTVMQTLLDLENERAAAALKVITASTMEKVHVEDLALAHALETQAYIQRSAARHADTLGVAGAKAETKKHRDALRDLRATLEANQHGFATWKEYVDSGTKGLKEGTKAAEEHNRKLLEMGRLMQEQVRAGEAAPDEAVKAIEKEDAAWMRSMNEKARGYKEQVEWQVRVNKETQEEAGKLNELGQVFSSTFSTANSAVSGAFAKMVVESKTWSDAFKHIMQDVEEQFVAMVAQMAIKWAMFQALTSGLGLGVPGVNSFLGKSFAGGFAEGGDFVASSPTMFLAGEAGPERVQVTPMAGGGGGGGGGTTVINAEIHVNGAQDAHAIGQEIVRQIRGMGQLDFVRAH